MATSLPDYLQHRQDRDDLKRAIGHEIQVNGNKCSLNHIDISHIRNMDGLFEDLPFDGDISLWDVSKVRNMARMFKGSAFNGDISKWDTGSVVTMDTMFSRAQFNGDISKWNISKVVDTTSMFYYAQFNGDISDWDLSGVIRMSSMFMGAEFTGDLSKWQMFGVGNLSYMFKDSKYNRDLSAWTINPIASTEEMFCRSTFQGAFPNIDLSESGRGVMLDDSYRGRFPDSYTMKDLSMVFGGSHPIDAYLRDTAKGPLKRVHIEFVLTSVQKPEWLSYDQFDWFVDQKKVCDGLGLDLQQSTSLVHQQYQEQNAKSPAPLETIVFDFSASA